MSMRCLSTNQVAKKLGINQGNFQRLIRQRKIPFPPLARVAGMKVRLWSSEDVERVKKVLVKRRKKRVKK